MLWPSGPSAKASSLSLGARSNPGLLAAVLGAVAVQLAILLLPALERLFDTQALSSFQLALVLWHRPPPSSRWSLRGGASDGGPKVPPETGLMALLQHP
jgi:hypothetical protein